MRHVLVGTALLSALFAWVTPGEAQMLRVMKVGLGHGTITSSDGGIDCGTNCDEAILPGVAVTLTATPGPDSTFDGWAGACLGSTQSCTFLTGIDDVAVTAKFDPSDGIPTLADVSPTGIEAFLSDPMKSHVDTAARFVAALPPEYRQNWILMSRSESLQTGTAALPRILLPSADARNVFTIGMATHSSYPGAHPNAIEYMQWDATEKNFRFHEVVVAPILAGETSLPERAREITFDDFKCTACHSTGNILNDTGTAGTTGNPAGAAEPRNKPNWDAYDSWGGMLPFNRDRLYQGSAEADAFRSLFNLWNWRGSPESDAARQVLAQLVLQSTQSEPPAPPSPHRIERRVMEPDDANHIVFGFDSPGTNPATRQEPVDYSFGRPAEPATTVVQGGRYVTLRHSNPMPDPGSSNDDYLSPVRDEGRGVQLFDLLGGLDGDLNGQRIADELVDLRFATGSVPIDARPVALAIAADCIVVDSGNNAVISNQGLPNLPTLDVDTAFFDARHGLGANQGIDALVVDTRSRQESLPRRKADIQALNLDRVGDEYVAGGTTVDGVLARYDSSIQSGTTVPVERLRREVFQRPVDLGIGAVEVGGDYVDRELYPPRPPNAEPVALYRYFLEPLGVPVDKWSMGVRGRSRTYTFADVLGSTENRLMLDLRRSLRDDPLPGISDPRNCAQLIDAVNSMFSPDPAQTSLPPAADVPTYTDIQRIFNRSCIECHGGLDYPPFANYNTGLDLSELESPVGPQDRFSNSYPDAVARAASLNGPLYQRLMNPVGPNFDREDCPRGIMPCGGPALSSSDIETIRRWIEGGNPRTAGDPHLHTIQGVNYDFQAAGEFVLLRGPGLEIQARHVPVPSRFPLGPNGHTGLTSCVSINGAVALRMGSHRITYQPGLSGEADPDGLELRVDGELIETQGEAVRLGSVRIMSTGVPGGLRIESLGGTSVILTPTFWSHHQLWYLNVDLRRARATAGLLGTIAPGNWLPALPNGRLLGRRPEDLQERYRVLYRDFGDAWRVHQRVSLFDYGRRTSTRSFTLPGWPLGESPPSCELPERLRGAPSTPAQEPIRPRRAERLCSSLTDDTRRRNCIHDVRVTGEAGFAVAYRVTEKVLENQAPQSPVLRRPEAFATGLGSAVRFRWTTALDRDRDPVRYLFCVWPAEEPFSFDVCELAPTGGSPVDETAPGSDRERRALGTSRDGFKSGQAYFWKVIAEDRRGLTSESTTRRFEVE